MLCPFCGNPKHPIARRPNPRIDRTLGRTDPEGLNLDNRILINQNRYVAEGINQIIINEISFSLMYGSRTFTRIYVKNHKEKLNELYTMWVFDNTLEKLRQNLETKSFSVNELDENFKEFLLPQTEKEIEFLEFDPVNEYQSVFIFLQFLCFIEPFTKNIDYFTKAITEYLSMLINLRMKSKNIQQIDIEGFNTLQVCGYGLKWYKSKTPIGTAGSDKTNLDFINNRYLIFEKLIKLSK